MLVHNNTAVEFIMIPGYLICGVQYDCDGELKIIPKETYRKSFEKEVNIHDKSRFIIQDVREEVIRLLKIDLNGEVYKPDNAQNFWGFVKSQLKWKKPAEKAIAEFLLPTIKSGDKLKTNLNHDIEMKNPSWSVFSKYEFRETLIDPEFHDLRLNYLGKILSATLIYRLKNFSNIIIKENK